MLSILSSAFLFAKIVSIWPGNSDEIYMKIPMRVFCRALFVSALIAVSSLLVSCASAPQSRAYPPFAIMGNTSVGEARLVSFLLVKNPAVNRDKAERMARYYIEEGRAEGVNPDIAFAQMCLETGFLRFGGVVTEDMNNFCGLGTIGPGQPGNSFPDERTGVRAHIQHLKGYATAEPLNGTLVDPRYKYVNPKGKSPTIQGLAGTWAADREYGVKLAALLEKLYA
jgi:hypothetical protein